MPHFALSLMRDSSSSDLQSRIAQKMSPAFSNLASFIFSERGGPV